MNSIDLTPGVSRIVNVLAAISTSLTINNVSEDKIEIVSQTDDEHEVFDLKFEFDRQQDISIFTVTTTDPIDKNGYILIMDMLNYMNVFDVERKFYLNPVSLRLCCSKGIHVSRGRVHLSSLEDSIPTFLSIAMEDLSKLMRCCLEQLPLRDALAITIGDPSEIMPLLQ